MVLGFMEHRVGEYGQIPEWPCMVANRDRETCKLLTSLTAGSHLTEERDRKKKEKRLYH